MVQICGGHHRVTFHVLLNFPAMVHTECVDLRCCWSNPHVSYLYGSPILCPSHVQVSSRTLAFALRRDYLPQMGIERRVAQGEEVHPPQAQQPRRPASYGRSCCTFVLHPLAPTISPLLMCTFFSKIVSQREVLEQKTCRTYDIYFVRTRI